MKRLLFLTVLIAVTLTMVWAGGDGEESMQQEDEYPSKPVTIVVPWDPGGGTDTLARAVLTVMGKYFPQPMVVVNRPGGGSTVGMTEALMAPADGYTIVITGIGTTVTQPLLKDLEYSQDDYEIVLQLNDIPRILVASPQTPYDTMEEMMEYARANPGEIISGISAVGTTGHFGTAQLELEHNVSFNNVPQGGGGPQRVAVLGGNADIANLTASEGGPLIQQGQLKGLCVMGRERFDGVPEVPTCEEVGYPVYANVAWHVYAPDGVPDDRIQMLHDAFKSAIEDPDFQPMAEKLNLGVDYATGEESEEALRELIEVYSRVAEELDLAG